MTTFDVYWTENNIMRIDVVQTLGWDRFYTLIDAIDTCAQERQEVDRIDIIFNATAPPAKGNPLPHFRNMYDLFKSIDNLVMVVNVAGKQQGNFARSLLNIIFSVSGAIKSVKFVGTLDEAETLIYKDRETSAPA